jgi:uroporphyrinogen-III synthase
MADGINANALSSATNEKLSEVKSVLISQPEPTDKNSPYHQLAQKYNLKISFKPFIEVQPVTAKEFRRQKINLLEHTAIIFTSQKAIDNFFAILKELKIEFPPETKYFCITPMTANYLQRYIAVRKRKVFTGKRTASDMFDLFKKHKNEKYLFPCSDIHRDDIPSYMSKNNIKLTKAVIYNTVAADMKSINPEDYDLIAFFSPSGVNSLKTNFPDFKQNKTRIAAFGPTTAKAVIDNGLKLDIEAPMPNAPSMTGAIELYVRRANNIQDAGGLIEEMTASGTPSQNGTKEEE